VGEQQVGIRGKEGVDLNRVYVGRGDDDTDLVHPLDLLNKGVWLGLDRYPGGRQPGTPQQEGRTEVSQRLLDAVFAHRIMLSHNNDVLSTDVTGELAEQR
jgi:predicted metal-dependent phosphotriesterase family hydrolase